jgi:hypothetical protein
MRFGALSDSQSITLEDFPLHLSGNTFCVLKLNTKPVQKQELDLCKCFDFLDMIDIFRCFKTGPMRLDGI